MKTEKPPSGLESEITRVLHKRQQAKTLRSLTIPSNGSADFSSNDFLSLSKSPALHKLIALEVSKLDQSGSGGSRLLDGNSQYAEDLEQRIARFHGAETALLCNSGFDANVSIFETLPQKDDIIIYDELIHASVHEGMKLTRAKKRLHFRHNDHQDLERVLRSLAHHSEEVSSGGCNVFIAVESVYSMDGDVAPLTEIVAAVHKYLPKGNGHMIVDEAHATGVIGQQGKGLVCKLGLEDRITIRMHTFGKALACNGAVIMCSELIKQYLINYAKPLIYTTFMSYPSQAAIKASYAYLVSGESVRLMESLQSVIQNLHKRLVDLSNTLRLTKDDRHLFRVPDNTGQSPISYVLTSDPKALAAFCQKRGLIVRGIVPPTVPKGTDRVRICMHSGNTVEEVDALVTAVREWVEVQLPTRGPKTKPIAQSRL